MINLTPHDINIVVEDSVLTLPASGTIARVLTVETITDSITINGVSIPVVTKSYKEVDGLPSEGVPCIVSAIVAGAVPGRIGVFYPDTGSTAIRDKGHIVGVVRLVKA